MSIDVVHMIKKWGTQNVFINIVCLFWSVTKIIQWNKVANSYLG